MTFYIGVDFHPHQQTLCWIDKQTGAMETLDLEHDLLKVKEFYSSLTEPAVIGIEASSRAIWFENMIAETGHKLVVGNPTAQNAIRSDVKLKAFYKRLAKKKPKAVAKTACARRLLVKLSIMLRDNITADEFDLRGRTVGNARNIARSETDRELIEPSQPNPPEKASASPSLAARLRMYETVHHGAMRMRKTHPLSCPKR